MPSDYRKIVKRWYKSARWQRMRRSQLTRHPFCQCPRHRNKKAKATVADHIKPHRGDARLFWDTRNLQSMAKQCHDSAKQTYEKSGHYPGWDESGMPDDPEHPWNTQ